MCDESEIQLCKVSDKIKCMERKEELRKWDIIINYKES